MSARIQVRIPQELKAQLETAAAAEGKTLPEYLKAHLPELTKSGLDVTFIEPTTGQPSLTIAPTREIDPLDDYVITLKKMAVAKMFQNLTTSPMSPEQQLQSLTQRQQPPPPSPTPDFSTKEMMDRLTVWKMLEGMEKKETDPEIKAMLKELKDAQIKATQTPKTPEKKEMTIEDLMKWMTFYRMAGQPEEAQKVQNMINQRLSEVTEKLHEAQLDMQRREAEWRHQDLLRQINDIKNAPTELDQISRMSELAEKDEAIRAYMNKKLGIKEKGEPLTPKKLKEYIESIQVPIGDILKELSKAFKPKAAAPPPPPPETAPPIPPEEIAALTEQRLPTEEVTPTEMPSPPPPEKTQAPKPEETPPPKKPPQPKKKSKPKKE